MVLIFFFFFFFDRKIESNYRGVNMKDFLKTTAELLVSIGIVYLIAYFLEQPTVNVVGWVALGMIITLKHEVSKLENNTIIIIAQ